MRCDIMRAMRRSVPMALVSVAAFAAALTAFPAAASGVTVGQLPPSPFADTEASTNVSVSVDLAAMTRMEFSLSLDASPTNCLEVAVGTDADGDGVLFPFEAAHTFGYRCGAWFARDALADAETETAEPRTGRLERLFVLKRRKLDPAWNLVRVTRRGVADIGEVVLAEGRKPGFALEVR